MTSLAHVAPLSLGARIAAARRERGLSQKQLASALHVSVWQVERFETGTVSPSTHLDAIAEVTGVRAGWFREQVESGQNVNSSVLESPRASIRALDVAGRQVVLGAITLLVTIRLFTEIVPVIPRAANFVDIPIFLVLGTAALFVSAPRVESGRWQLPFGLVGCAFLGLAVLSAVVNSVRTEPGPVLVFLYGFLAPLGVYAAVYRLWPSGNARALSRTIVALGLLELAVVAVVDVPRFVSSRNPDDISGTFGTNAYQLVFFLLVFVTLVVGIASLEPSRRTARFAPVLILATFATILLAQYRSLLVSMVVAVVAIMLLFGGRTRGLVIVGWAALGFVIIFHYVATGLPRLKLQAAASSLANNPGEYARGRLRIVEHVSRLYGDMPATIVIGAGPGTYSSRAWQTFANAGSTSHSNVAGSYVSGLTSGKTYTTDVAEKYVLPQLRTGAVVQGSHAVSSPYSSYTSLLAEVGILGFALIAGAYFGAVGRAWRMARFALTAPVRGDPLAAVVLATAIAFLTLVQMALLENWFEVTRVTFVAWTLLAVSAKELDAREAS